MHIASDPSLHRPGWIYDANGVGYPAGNEPWIMWHHIDGPLLHFRNGELHWMTMWERMLCWLGQADALSLERKHLPHLSQ